MQKLDLISQSMRNDIDQILENLYLSNMFAAQNLELLQRHKITHIITVMNEFHQKHKKHFKIKEIQVEDVQETNLLDRFQECFDFIDEARDKGQAVLVHCAAGVSRSATIVIGYCMYKEKMTMSDAFYHVINMRPKISPNEGFIKQLKIYEEVLNLQRKDEESRKQILDGENDEDNALQMNYDEPIQDNVEKID